MVTAVQSSRRSRTRKETRKNQSGHSPYREETTAMSDFKPGLEGVVAKLRDLKGDKVTAYIGNIKMIDLSE